MENITRWNMALKVFGNLNHSSDLKTALEVFAEAFNEMNQFVIYFETRSRDIRKEVFIGEDLLQQHLESWRAHYSLWFDGFLNGTGVPAVKPVLDVPENAIKIEKKPAKDILAALLSLKLYSPEMSSLENVLYDMSKNFEKSISAFKYDKKHFDTLEEMHNYQILYDKDEIRNIETRMAAIPELSLNRDDVKANCDLLDRLVDLKIKLRSEIAKREIIKEVISDLSHKLVILIKSMKALAGKIGKAQHAFLSQAVHE